MKRRWMIAAVLAAPWGILACEEVTPTSLDEGRIPVDPTTVEVVLEWDDFADSLSVYGGFGTPDELGSAVVAHEYEGTLEARTLVRWAGYPFRASVRDSLGTVRPDSNFTFVGGRVVARLDTLSSTNGDEPVTLSLGALTEPWHVSSATWTVAVDTAGDTRPWPEPGAGPVVELGEAVWDPAEGDSVTFEVDSATVAMWSDSLDASRGARISLLASGERIDVRSVNLRLDARPNIHRDTIVVLNAAGAGLTFVYDPVPPPPPGGIRIGGVPAWRSVIRVALPRVLNGPATLCQQVGCPFELEPSRVNHASLLLTSEAVQPAAFQPSDSIRLDVRSVLAPERLPKSPLGSSFVGSFGRAIAPEAFGEEAGQTIAVPVTSFIRAQVEADPEVEPPHDLALLSLLEPLSLSFAAFAGPDDGAAAPRLRLIVTAADTVEIR